MTVGWGGPGEHMRLRGSEVDRELWAGSGESVQLAGPDPQVGEWAAGLEFQPQWDAYLDTATEEAAKIRDKGASELPEAPHLVKAGQPRARPDTQTTPGGDGLGSPLLTPPHLFPTWFSQPLRQGVPGLGGTGHLQCTGSWKGRSM